MVWPFTSRDASAAATFEKTLANLSTKITRAQNKDTGLRSSNRRYKALWTLYTSFAYTIYTVVLVLVTGYQHWGTPEYGAVVGGPLLIWGVRMLIGAAYDWRIASNGQKLDGLKKQKAEAVRKFKEATKYNETEKLLEKYGAEVRKVPEEKSEGVAENEKPNRGKKGPQKPPQPRTNLPPPPTANIQRGPQHAPQLMHPQQLQQPSSMPGSPQNPNEMFTGPSNRRDSTASFAPNASEDFQSPPQYAAPAGRQWYDRLMDVLLGEDEMKPINRMALICRHCKLVNGQAPPGMKDVGRWRCMGCKEWNGEEDEVAAILEEANEDGDEGEKDMETIMRERKDIEREAEHGDEHAAPASRARSKKKRDSDET